MAVMIATRATMYLRLHGLKGCSYFSTTTLGISAAGSSDVGRQVEGDQGSLMLKWQAVLHAQA